MEIENSAKEFSRLFAALCIKVYTDLSNFVWMINEVENCTCKGILPDLKSITVYTDMSNFVWMFN